MQASYSHEEDEYNPCISLTFPFLGNPVVHNHSTLDVVAFISDLYFYSNLTLIVLFCYVWYLSSSNAVLACGADLAVDIACQTILIIAERKIIRMDPKFPIGKTRLDAVAVILSTCVMTAAATEVVHHAVWDLYQGLLNGILPSVQVDYVVISILAFAMLYKSFLWLVCWLYSTSSEAVDALATESFNSAASTLLVAIAASVTNKFHEECWFVDSLGALTVVLFIVGTYSRKVKRQISKIAGRAAPETFVTMLEQMALSHYPGLQVDVIRAYHFGSRYLVEMEVVLPPEMTVAESQDIALLLQHKVEALYEVERAFVIVDYKKRTEPKHKVERNLLRGARDIFASDHQRLLQNSGPSSSTAAPAPVRLLV